MKFHCFACSCHQHVVRSASYFKASPHPDLKSTLSLSNLQPRQHGFIFLPIIGSWIDLLELHIAAVDLEGLVGAVNVGPLAWRDVSPFVLCDRAWCLSSVQSMASEGLEVSPA